MVRHTSVRAVAVYKDVILVAEKRVFELHFLLGFRTDSVMCRRTVVAARDDVSCHEDAVVSGRVAILAVLDNRLAMMIVAMTIAVTNEMR